MWVGIAVALSCAGVGVWWLSAPARTRRREADARRKRYVVKDSAERVGIAEARGVGKPTGGLTLDEIRPVEMVRGAGAVSNGVVTGRLVQTPAGERILTTPPFVMRESVLGERGARYFQALSARVPAWVVVCPKVRLEALVTPTNPVGHDAVDWATWRKRVRLRSVDYVLCDRRTFKPLVAIVFDRPGKRASHAEVGGGQDRIPDEVLQTAGLKLLRLSGEFSKDWGLIKPYVDQAILASVDEDEIDRVHGAEAAELFEDVAEEQRDRDRGG
jgi:Protein of unknown function (DUF2726)